MRPRLTLVLAVATLAGCGGADRPAAPRLEARVAAPIAAQADRVAVAFERGDGCAARTAAAKLQRQTIGAINTGDVPPALQEELTAAVNRVAARAVCTPPPPPTAAPTPSGDEGDDESAKHGNGKKAKKRKGKDD